MARNGCKKVVIVNGHGGNEHLLPYFSQTQLEKQRDYVVYVLPLFDAPPGGPAKKGRFSVSIQSDGDLMYAPGVLWTAARHKIPLLAVMHNNRGYHQEVMHVQRLANFHNRVASLGNDMGPTGTSIENPDIEYHKLAESMGWWAKGPIKDPAQLGAAIKEAVAVVRSEERSVG